LHRQANMAATRFPDRPRAAAARSMLRCTQGLFLALLLAQTQPAAGSVNIDGGRSQLPGMKQDMFDRAQREKGKPGARMGKGPPDCPKSDKMSPFFGLAFVGKEMFIKMNSSDEQCTRLLTIGGANYTVLANASRTCGPAGEWKKRIAEELSAVFFQAGLDWVKNENDTIEIVTEDGTFEIPVDEARYAGMSACWARGCGCEQAQNPAGKAILLTCLAIAVGGLFFDSLKMTWKKFKGEKPPKHVQCKKVHRLEEVKLASRHLCDVCGKSGTCYACTSGCPYDMCKVCYKEAKKKLKTELQEWYEKHPEDKAKDEEKKKEKKKKGEKDGSDDDADTKESKADSEAESTSKAESESGKAESGKEDAESGKETAESESGKAESGKEEAESGKEVESKEEEDEEDGAKES